LSGGVFRGTLAVVTSEAERIIGLYQRHARAWASDRGAGLYEDGWLDRFLGLLPPSPAVLDIGCGSGTPIAAYLMQQGCAVTGVDSSPEMIAMGHESFPDGDWRIADMRILSLGRRFGGVIAWDSFFHLSHDDQRGMFSVFRDHIAPGGGLMFTSGPAHGEAIGAFRGEPLYHASLDGAEYRALLDAYGFDVVAHVVEDPACGGRTVWLAKLR
jgi:SAM-dependent methyltransferase